MTSLETYVLMLVVVVVVLAWWIDRAYLRMNALEARVKALEKERRPRE